MAEASGEAVEGAGAQEQDGDLFSALPKEMKLRILTCLTHNELLKTVALVCKGWRELSEDAGLWHVVRLNGERVSWERAVDVFTRRTQVKKLRLQNMQEGVDDVLDAVGTCVEKLELYDITLERSNTLGNLVRRNTNLREVVFRSMETPEDNENIIDILNNSKVEMFRVYRSSSALPADVTLIRNYPNLKEICIYPPTGLSGIRALLASTSNQLRKLIVPVTEEPSILSVLGLCRQLEELQFTGLPKLTDVNLLNKAVSQLHNLRYLSVTCALTAASLRRFLSLPSLSKLQKLNLFNSHYMDKACLSAVAQNCRLLTHLDLSCCPNVTVESLLEIITFCKRLRTMDAIRCPGLELTQANLADIAELNSGLVIRCARKRGN